MCIVSFSAEPVCPVPLSCPRCIIRVVCKNCNTLVVEVDRAAEADRLLEKYQPFLLGRWKSCRNVLGRGQKLCSIDYARGFNPGSDFLWSQI